MLRNCARCGGEHEVVEGLEIVGELFPAGVNVIVWRKLERPIADPAGEFTHWAPCPTNGDPVLMRKTAAPA